MIDYIENDPPNKTPIHVFIGEEEWKNYSFQNKVRLLYRLRQSDNALAKDLVKAIELLVEEEQSQREIDYDATISRIEDEN